MYVAELDRPWTDTPFKFQGFVLKSEDELDILRRYCSTVQVDVERGSVEEAHRYPARASLEQEFAPARKTYATSRELVDEALAAARIGRTLDARQVRGAVQSMTQSVLRNPDALLLFSQLREKGDYTSSHAMDVSIYMTAFGRFLQLEREEIEFLAYLGLLQDIGKMRLPKALLEQRARLTAKELAQVRLHVVYSAEILYATPGLPPGLADAAVLHHERRDGSGYPNGLAGDAIGMTGSIAAIVDTFDAMTVRRPYADPVPPSTAISTLYKARGALFDAGLVEQFIRFLGIFPVGSLVELNSGEIGIVISQNPEQRLKPRVMVFRDAKGNELRPQKLIDLSRPPRALPGEPYRIQRTLERDYAPLPAERLFMT